MRSLVCLGVVLALTTVVSADDKEKGEAKLMRAKIVKVDAASNTITIRDADNKEQELKVSDTTKFFDKEKKPLATGLKDESFKEGTEVWYRVGTGTDRNMVTEVHLSRPGDGN